MADEKRYLSPLLFFSFLFPFFSFLFFPELFRTFESRGGDGEGYSSVVLERDSTVADNYWPRTAVNCRAPRQRVLPCVDELGFDGLGYGFGHDGEPGVFGVTPVTGKRDPGYHGAERGVQRAEGRERAPDID